MILMLVLADQPDGIGLLIAAKSILRFNELARDAGDRRASEYVIIGTLASFAWAIGTAWATAAVLAGARPLRRNRHPHYLSGQVQDTRTPMFGIPGKPPVTMTPAAEAQIARLMARGGTKGLRIGVKKGGCAGMEYTMEYVDEIAPHDEVVESNGARVMIAPMAQMFLFGTEIDYASGLLESGFKFNNPNVTEACGCGKSIKFAEQLRWRSRPRPAPSCSSSSRTWAASAPGR